MNKKQVKEVCDRYERLLTLKGINSQRGGSSLEHALWMVSQIEDFVDKDKMEKAFRWLGFVQGVLWMQGVYSIDDMREHNRSAK